MRRGYHGEYNFINDDWIYEDPFTGEKIWKT